MAAVPGRFHIEFEQDVHHQIFVCGNCKAHIVLAEDLKQHLPIEGLTACTFDRAMNLRIGNPQINRDIGILTVTDVYCYRCGELLGLKIVNRAPGITTFQHGWKYVKMEKLLLWIKGQGFLNPPAN